MGRVGAVIWAIRGGTIGMRVVVVVIPREGRIRGVGGAGEW